MAVGVVGERPETLWDSKVPSGGYSQDALIDLLCTQISAAHDAHPDVSAVGIGIPATIDSPTGHAISSANLELADAPIRDIVFQRVGLPVVLDNDANVAMLAETAWGSAKGAKYAAMMTIGTGIGGGLLIDGKIFRGARGAGAELGHTVVDIDGPRCQGNCRGYGCIEAVASGTAIGREGRNAAAANPDSALGKVLAEGQTITGREVTVAAQAGDPVALEVLQLIGHRLGNAFVSIANTFQPEVIVVGGGAIAAGDLILDTAREFVRQHALPPMDETPIRLAALGPDAGMIGAALLGRIGLEGHV